MTLCVHAAACMLALRARATILKLFFLSGSANSHLYPAGFVERAVQDSQQRLQLEARTEVGLFTCRACMACLQELWPVSRGGMDGPLT